MTADNLRWSTPVLVRDPDEGDYQAVFDRSFPTGYKLNQIKAVAWGRSATGIAGRFPVDASLAHALPTAYP
jgi:hypothetical protein